MLLAFLACAFATGCEEAGSDVSSSASVVESATMNEAADAFVANVWSAGPGNPIVFDGQKFFADNREEIRATLEIVDTLTVGDLGVALVRYSLGTDVYRSAVWMRKMDGLWWPSGSQYFSEYSDDYDALSEDMQQRADSVITKVDAWKEESKKAWWTW